MSGKRGQWHTPLSQMAFRTELFKKLEKCPHDLEAVGTNMDPPLFKKMTYFNNLRKYKKLCMYDVAFNQPPGYNQRMHRDDRQDLRIIHENIFQQEKYKRVPPLTSLQYARPWAVRLEVLDAKYFLNVGVGGFYTRTGVNVTPDLERQCIKCF